MTRLGPKEGLKADVAHQGMAIEVSQGSPLLCNLLCTEGVHLLAKAKGPKLGSQDA